MNKEGTMEYHSAIKRWNLAICDNMDGLWGNYAKWNKSGGKTKTVWFHSYIAYKTESNTLTKKENKQKHRQYGGYQREEVSSKGQRGSNMCCWKIIWLGSGHTMQYADNVS